MDDEKLFLVSEIDKELFKIAVSGDNVISLANARILLKKLYEAMLKERESNG